MLHKGMKGGLSGDSQTPATLTAYVLIALLEAKEYIEVPVKYQFMNTQGSLGITSILCRYFRAEISHLKNAKCQCKHYHCSH